MLNEKPRDCATSTVRFSVAGTSSGLSMMMAMSSIYPRQRDPGPEAPCRTGSSTRLKTSELIGQPCRTPRETGTSPASLFPDRSTGVVTQCLYTDAMMSTILFGHPDCLRASSKRGCSAELKASLRSKYITVFMARSASATVKVFSWSPLLENTARWVRNSFVGF